MNKCTGLQEFKGSGGLNRVLGVRTSGSAPPPVTKGRTQALATIHQISQGFGEHIQVFAHAI
jgi:hypothetical protein